MLKLSSIERVLTAEEYRQFFDLATQMPALTIDGICAQIWSWREELQELSRTAIARRIRLIRLEFDTQRQSAQQLKAFKQALGEDASRTNEVLASFQLQQLLKDFQERLPEFELAEQAQAMELMTKIYGTFARARHGDRRNEINEAKLEIESGRTELEERRIAVLEDQLRLKQEQLEEQRQKAEKVAKEAEASAKAAGLSEDVAAEIRARILGIAS